MVKESIILHENDNVAVALNDITTDNNKTIPLGHKFSLCSMKPGDIIYKYGMPIGKLLTGVDKGEHIHTHNLKTLLDQEGELIYKYSKNDLVVDFNNKLNLSKEDYFYGYLRDNGKVGVRNEIWIIDTVGCIQGPSKKLQLEAYTRYYDQIKSGQIDGVYSFSHPYGCSRLGDNLKMTKDILSGLINHPNAGGVLVLGLGCENNNINELKKYLIEQNELTRPNSTIEWLNSQEVNDEIKTGMCKLDILVNEAIEAKRSKQPISKLIVGLECGGSDALSGITANTLLGNITNYLIERGGGAILSEVPEMFGAEKDLMNRAKNKDVYNKIVNLINDFKNYFRSNNQKIYKNPSPGNHEGGITTLEEKSLGNVKKSGNAIIKDVLDYGDSYNISEGGLQLLSTPGNDLISSTAMAAAGAQLITFTTGRGTPLGSPVPVIKVSSNTNIYNLKPHWIDFDAGRLINEDFSSIERELLDLIRKISSGSKKTNNEKNGYREIDIWKDGIVL